MVENNTLSLKRRHLEFVRNQWSWHDVGPRDFWTHDGVYLFDDPMSYDLTLQLGLKYFYCENFTDLTDLLSQKLKRKVHVVDLMGGAYFLQNLQNVETIVGIRNRDKDVDFSRIYGNKNDHYAQAIMQLIKSKKRRVIEADLLRANDWQQLFNQKLPKADLLVCRPSGPFSLQCSSIVHEPRALLGLFLALFGKMLRLVNQQTGVIFSEIPDVCQTNDIDTFIRFFYEQTRANIRLYQVQSAVGGNMGFDLRRYFVIHYPALELYSD